MAGLKDYYEQQAQTMIDSIGGNDPNPQLAYDALQTQSTDAVAQAGMTGDPTLDSVIQANPSPDSGYAGTRDQNPDGSDPNFWKNYEQWNSQQDDSVKTQFAGVNGIPVADPTYMKGVQYWVGKDQKQRDEWRKLLDKTGSYITKDANGQPITGHPQGGDWSSSDEQALQLYMRNLAIPAALFSKDGKKQQAAQNLLNEVNSNLGIDESVQDLSDKVKKDPKTQADFAIGWIMTHPDQSDQRHLISQYTDMYGDQNVPQALRDLHDPGIFSKIWNAPDELWGQIDNAFSGLESLIPGPGADTHKKAQAIESKAKNQALYPTLTPDQLTQLAGAVQDANDHKGYLGTIQQAIQETGTKAALTTTWGLYGMARDAMGGQIPNVGDDFSHAYNWADAHKDNLMAGIMGDDWANQHQTWTTAANFTGGMLFDPTMLLGPVGRVATLGKDINRINRLTEGLDRSALGLAGLKDTVSANALNRLKYALNPEKFMKQLRNDTLAPVFLSPQLNMSDRMKLLDIADGDPHIQMIRDLHDEKGALKSQAARPGEVEGLAGQVPVDGDFVKQMLDDHFDHVVSVGGTFYNYQSHLKALSPETMRRISAGGITKLMAIGGLKIGAGISDFSDAKLLDGVESLEHWAAAKGIKKSDIDETVNKLMSAPEHARADIALDFLDKHILGDNLPKGFAEWLAKRKADRLGQYADRVPPSVQPQIKYAIEPRLDHPAKELSVAPRRLEDKMRVLADGIKEQIDELNQKAAQAFNLDGTDESLKAAEADPLKKNAVADYKKQLEALQRKLEDVAPLGTERAAPMFPGQLASHVVMPFSIQDLITYSNPILRKVTSNRAYQLYERYMSMWKLWEVAKPSTALRASGGDDTLRWSMDLADWGSPEAAAKVLTSRALRKSVLALPRSIRTFLEGEAKGVKAVFSKEDWEKAAEVLGPELSQAVHGMLDGAVHRDFGYLEPADGAAYRQVLTHLLSDTYNHQFVRDWALHRSETGSARAKQVIEDFYKSEGSSGKPILTGQAKLDDEWFSTNIAHHKDQIKQLEGQITGDPNFDNPADVAELKRQQDELADNLKKRKALRDQHKPAATDADKMRQARGLTRDDRMAAAGLAAPARLAGPVPRSRTAGARGL